jgi:hypothetical protein
MFMQTSPSLLVTPAKAGAQLSLCRYCDVRHELSQDNKLSRTASGVPACAGMTRLVVHYPNQFKPKSH